MRIVIAFYAIYRIFFIVRQRLWQSLIITLVIARFRCKLRALQSVTGIGRPQAMALACASSMRG